MATKIGCSPVAVRPVIAVADAACFRAEVSIDPAEPVFAGHYPGLPIFPGVCLVELVRLATLACLPETADGWRLAAIESCRFLRPLRPGDLLTIDAEWTAVAVGEGRRCSTVLTSEGGVVARIRLRLAAGDDEGGLP